MWFIYKINIFFIYLQQNNTKTHDYETSFAYSHLPADDERVQHTQHLETA